jgi:ATP-dependent RNA helicase MSS116
MAGLPPVYKADNLKEAHAQTFKSLGNMLQAPFLKALDNMGYE